jgi:hypothetical protein
MARDGFALAGACPMPGPTARGHCHWVSAASFRVRGRSCRPCSRAQRARGRRSPLTRSLGPRRRRRRPAGTAGASRAPQKGTVLSCPRARARKAAQAAEFLEQHGPGRPRAIGPSRSFRLVWSPSSRLRLVTLAVRDRSRGTNLTLNQRAESAPRAPRAGYMMQHTQPGNHDSAWTLQG